MKRIFRYILLSLMIVAGALTLTACHNTLPPPPPTGPYPLTPYQRGLAAKVRASGARVIKQARVLEIVMPVDTFFRRGTTHLKPRKTHAVKLIAKLVKSYTDPMFRPRIYVTGHTDDVFNIVTRRRLSRQYAHEVAAYLWHRGIAKRWVRVRGVGDISPLASNGTPRGAAYNRRVVIRVY